MHRQLSSVVIACLAAAAIALPAGAAATQAAAPAPANSVSFTNSGAPDPAAPQINSVTVSNDGSGEVTFQVKIANRPQLTSDMLIGLALNTDQNPASGDPGSGGADYMIFLDSSGIELHHWNGNGFDPASPRSQLSYTYAPDGATINVNAADLGGTSGFTFFARAISGISTNPSGNPDFSNTHNDDAPRQGSWTYQLKTAPLTLSARAFQTQPSRPAAGRPFQALMAVTRSDGAKLTNAQISCTATIAGKPLPAKAHGIVGDVVWCGWLIPKTAHGKTLHATLSINSGGAQANRSYTSKIG